MTINQKLHHKVSRSEGKHHRSKQRIPQIILKVYLSEIVLLMMDRK